MRFLFVVAVLLVGVAALGFYRGWFRLSTDNAGSQPSATFTVDKDKFHADEKTVKDKVQGLGQEAKDKFGNRGGKVIEPERQP